MKSVVFFNNKGGVGKTTLACNIAAFLNDKMGKKALLIDSDPQCNATQSILSDDVCEQIYLNNDPAYSTLYTVVKPIDVGEPRINEHINPMPPESNNFATPIIPGHPRMSIIEDKLSDAWSKTLGGQIGGIRTTNWCNDLIRHFSGSYDLVIFDVGPSLGALNRSVLLSCDFILTPLGCDIFSLLGISNISTWIQHWQNLYNQGLSLADHESPGTSERYQAVRKTEERFRLIGYSVQQYVTRTFKEGRRPVRAYDDIMKRIPDTVDEALSFLFPKNLNRKNLELGHIPYLYSLIPMSQTAKTPIHLLERKDGVIGSQYKQVKEYADLMENVCSKLLSNMMG